MDIETIYPLETPPDSLRLRAAKVLGWPMALAGYFCIILDLFTTRLGWSLVVAWSLWMVWSTLVSPPLVERNRISFFIKLLVKCCVLLILIDVLLAPGWAGMVVPIVCFSGLVGSMLLFFTDSLRQRQNMLPLLLIAVSVLSALIGLISGRFSPAWPLALMGATALAELALCASVLGQELWREVQKRFHTQ